ncbi:hypothetical protein JCM9279_004249 [Rhodotorula babjevae]
MDVMPASAAAIRPGAATSSPSASATAPATGLINLPLEILDLVVHWVALQRFEYSESRRPRPSALHHLAYGTNKLVRRAALPLLCRRPDEFKDGAPKQVWMPGEGLVDVDTFIRTWRQPRGTSAHPPPGQTRLESLAFYRLVVPQGAPLLNVKHLELRRPVHDYMSPGTTSDCIAAFPNLASCTVVEPDQFLLRDLSSLEHLVDFALVVRPHAQVEMGGLSQLYRRLRRLEIQVFQQRRVHEPVVEFPLVVFLHENTFPAVDAHLQDLSLSVRLDPTLRSVPQPMQPVLQALKTAFGSCRLAALSLDEYTTCAPQDLALLASTFPTLERLSLPDRTIWDGSRADLLAALAPLTALTTLSCRLFPTSPASTYDTPSPASLTAQAVLDDPHTPALDNRDHDDANDFASPHAIALEAAAHLPCLELCGFIGQHSGIEWVRVYRNEEGRPERAEGVTIFEMDLERP